MLPRVAENDARSVLFPCLDRWELHAEPGSEDISNQIWWQRQISRDKTIESIELCFLDSYSSLFNVFCPPCTLHAPGQSAKTVDRQKKNVILQFVWQSGCFKRAPGMIEADRGHAAMVSIRKTCKELVDLLILPFWHSIDSRIWHLWRDLTEEFVGL